MAVNRFAKRLARAMLAEQGTEIIWRLHVDAAALNQTGNRAAADVFLQIADAAEREWGRSAANAELDPFRSAVLPGSRAVAQRLRCRPDPVRVEHESCGLNQTVRRTG
jgi:hypothetical protein